MECHRRVGMAGKARGRRSRRFEIGSSVAASASAPGADHSPDDQCPTKPAVGECRPAGGDREMGQFADPPWAVRSMQERHMGSVGSVRPMRPQEAFHERRVDRRGH